MSASEPRLQSSHTLPVGVSNASLYLRSVFGGLSGIRIPNSNLHHDSVHICALYTERIVRCTYFVSFRKDGMRQAYDMACRRGPPRASSKCPLGVMSDQPRRRGIIVADG